MKSAEYTLETCIHIRSHGECSVIHAMQVAGQKHCTTHMSVYPFHWTKKRLILIKSSAHFIDCKISIHFQLDFFHNDIFRDEKVHSGNIYI